MSEAGHILIVEDRESLRRLMRRALEQADFSVTTAESATAGIHRLSGERPGGVRSNNDRSRALRPSSDRFDLVITDLKLGDGTGLEVLAASREHHPDTPVVVLTAFGTVQTAVEAMKLGAVDFLEKPLAVDDLYTLVRSHLGDGEEGYRFEAPGAPTIVGRHPKLGVALKLLRKVAPTESTVLITGESGTGKELFARTAHALSRRADKPFVAINCAAIPETLMENELFGHEKGAFTGAGRRQAGRFEQAAGGTIFLDEIGELKLEVQGKILRVLEERTFERVGSGKPLRADVRIVAATNRELLEMVRSGDFRQDLYYRLDVFPITLPSLRERPSDIPHLARHLVKEIAQRLERPAPEIANDVCELLTDQAWPGNVRQLANLLERALILSEDPVLRRSDLTPFITPEAPVSERERIRDALTATEGDKALAAERLGMSYRTLQRHIKRLDLEGFPKYRS